jgi:adenosylmethionine-8-amino-7-oxononanoate aminotransferase
MRIWPAAYLRQARELTKRAGIPLIADEVLTGFGRTGKFLACEHALASPDILCLSKALTGGYLPLGATLCTEEVYQAFLSEDRDRTLLHGHSYTGNALSCAVGLESLAVFDEECCLERVGRLERVFNQRLDALRGAPGILDARGIGGIAAIELTPSAGAGRPESGYFDDVGPRLYREFLARDILLRPLGNIVYVMPPYAITDEEAHHVFDVIEEVIRLCLPSASLH